LKVHEVTRSRNEERRRGTAQESFLLLSSLSRPYLAVGLSQRDDIWHHVLYLCKALLHNRSDVFAIDISKRHVAGAQKRKEILLIALNRLAQVHGIVRRKLHHTQRERETRDREREKRERGKCVYEESERGWVGSVGRMRVKCPFVTLLLPCKLLQDSGNSRSLNSERLLKRYAILCIIEKMGGWEGLEGNLLISAHPCLSPIKLECVPHIQLQLSSALRLHVSCSPRFSIRSWTSPKCRGARRAPLDGARVW
jgi:hypothetical protein